MLTGVPVAVGLVFIEKKFYCPPLYNYKYLHDNFVTNEYHNFCALTRAPLVVSEDNSHQISH